MKKVIYVCPLSPPYLTLSFQEETCRTVCEMKNLQEIEIIRDEKNEKMSEIIENIENYECIIVYTFACLGKNLEEIIHSIKKILDNKVKLISIFDPVNLENFGENPTENMFLTLAIGSAIHLNKKWEEILEFRKK